MNHRLRYNTVSADSLSDAFRTFPYELMIKKLFHSFEPGNQSKLVIHPFFHYYFPVKIVNFEWFAGNRYLKGSPTVRTMDSVHFRQTANFY